MGVKIYKSPKHEAFFAKYHCFFGKLSFNLASRCIKGKSFEYLFLQFIFMHRFDSIIIALDHVKVIIAATLITVCWVDPRDLCWLLLPLYLSGLTQVLSIFIFFTLQFQLSDERGLLQICANSHILLLLLLLHLYHATLIKDVLFKLVEWVWYWFVIKTIIFIWRSEANLSESL